MSRKVEYRPTGWFAGKAGKTAQAVREQFKMHGVPKRKVGCTNHYHVPRGLSAMELGEQLDKRNAAAEIAEMEKRGIDPDNIVYRTKLAQLHKIDLQCDQLRTELDVIRGNLANVDEIANRYTRLLADMAQRLSTWRESTIAKRPKLRKEIEGCYRQLQASLEVAGE
jgi:hypothetical protein